MRFGFVVWAGSMLAALAAAPVAFAQDNPATPCDEHAGGPATPKGPWDHWFKLTLEVVGDPIFGWACVYLGENEEENVVYSGLWQPGKSVVFSHEFPGTLVTVRFITPPGVVGTAASANVSLGDCPSRVAQIDLRIVHQAPTMIGADHRGACVQAAEEAAGMNGLGLQPGPSSTGSWRALAQERPAALVGDKTAEAFDFTAAWALTIPAFAVVGWWPALRAAVVVAFSRLLQSDATRHPTRAALLEAVRHDPGVHGDALRRRLDVGRGQFLHHANVLVRLGALQRVHFGGWTHYFEARRHRPAELRRLSALHHPTLGKTLREIEKDGTRPLREVAQRLGLRPAAASKAVTALERAGLARRVRDRQGLRVAPAEL